MRCVGSIVRAPPRRSSVATGSTRPMARNSVGACRTDFGKLTLGLPTTPQQPCRRARFDSKAPPISVTRIPASSATPRLGRRDDGEQINQIKTADNTISFRFSASPIQIITNTQWSRITTRDLNRFSKFPFPSVDTREYAARLSITSSEHSPFSSARRGPIREKPCCDLNAWQRSSRPSH